MSRPGPVASAFLLSLQRGDWPRARRDAVVHNAEERAEADPGLLRIVARAHDFQERLIQDSDLTVPAIASQERFTIGYLSRLLRLPSLAPEIVTAIINGKHPPQLSAKRLMRLALNLPTDWSEQRKLLGFQGE